MKKQLLLSALALLGAGALSGCCNCGSNGGDCDDFIAVEAIEVVPCPSKEKCKDKKHHHVRQKDCSKKTQKDNAGNSSDSSCSVHGKTALADCGGNCGNSGNGNTGNTDTTGTAN